MEKEIDTSLFKEFLQVEAEIKEKQERLKEIRPLMFNIMKDLDVKQVVVENKGMFYMKVSKTYHYSSLILSQEQRVNQEIEKFETPLLKEIEEFSEPRLESIKLFKDEKLTPIEELKRDEEKNPNTKVDELPTVAFRKEKSN